MPRTRPPRRRGSADVSHGAEQADARDAASPVIGQAASYNEGMLTLRLLITLDDIEPAIWRRVLVPARFTLNGLHRVIQAAFGWQDCHLHRFEADHVRYENLDLTQWEPTPRDWCDRLLAQGVDPAEVEMLRTPPRDERKVRLGDMVDRGIREITYLYDFGDDWAHTVEIEGVERVDVGRLPALLGGERSAPPEASGGLPGYEQIQCVYAGESTDEWGRELAQWARSQMGPSWTLETFELELIQDRLSRTWRGPRS